MQGASRVLLLVVVLAAVVAVSAKKAAVNKWARQAQDHSIIRKVNSMDTTWEAGVNSKFQGLTLGEAKRYLGAKLDGPKLPRLHVSKAKKAAVPAEFDSREQWGSMCASLYEVRDQSDCGSCWAFGASESMTDRMCIASNGTKTPHLSAADLLACCDECGDGCDGGYSMQAWQYWVDTGLVTGGNYSTTVPAKDNGCYPYPFPPCEHHVNATHYPKCPSDEYETPSCPNKCSNGATWTKDKVHGKSAYSLATVADIQADLVAHGPIEVAFQVYEDFLTYKSGVYQHVTGEDLGGHAVKLIGYGVEDGVKYWTIMNSWNSDWGDNGQFKILRGSDECGIEDDAVAGLAL